MSYTQPPYRQHTHTTIDMTHNHEIVEDDDYKVTIDYDNLTTTFEPKVPLEIAKAIQYLEYRRLRHKHPHV